jgi:glycosyltransferase involved in cell wall biosynthesis
MKVLFIEPYPIEGPSSRYRVEQYVPYLRDKGLRCIVRPFVSSPFYKVLYKKGFYFKKILFFLWSSIGRFFDIFIAMRSDVIFIHLEAFPLGPPMLEYLFKKMGKRIIYDLDDAIYRRTSSPANRFFRYLRSPSKIKKIIEISDYVITCNGYLEDYARRFNKNVISIHTSVDTEKFTLRSYIKKDIGNVTIGWIGSHSTAPYLKELEGVLRRLSVNHSFSLKIIGAGYHGLDIPGVDIENLNWDIGSEITEFQSLDIGVYPLPENEWTLGKTGFKAIQYMSVGVPCVASNVGANRDIVKDGVNGYLARTEEEWFEKLSALIMDRDLRIKIGSAGRRTVEEKYSINVNAPKYFNIIKKP